jgi:3(or 17)beta-hydroxysteroid dehydrogenase
LRDLTNKIVLVTGGATGLGKAIAQRLTAEGACVVITDVQGDLGETTASECGFTFLEQDVCDEAQWPHVVGNVERRFGRLDILVNNAGVLGPMDGANPENTTLANWRRIFTVNVEGVFLGCRASIPAMRRAGGGSIVNISSVASTWATPHATAYGASKAAVRQLTKSIAQYCAQEKLNVRCNSVHPHGIRTPLLDRSMEEMAWQQGISLDRVVTDFKTSIPLGDFTQPEDVAAAVAYLASDEARRLTGTALFVDGGSVNCDTFWASRRDS